MSEPIFVLGGRQTDFARNLAREGGDLSDLVLEATLMEVYSTGTGAGALPAPALVQEVEVAMAQALQGLLLGARHTEAFLPCA